MGKFTQIIQEQLMQAVGSNVKIFLKGGQEVLGVIVNVDDDHVLLRKTGGRSSTMAIAIDMIGGLDIPDEEQPMDFVEAGDHKGTPLPEKKYVQIEPDPRTGDHKGTPLQSEVLKRWYEIEARFSTKIQAAKIEVQSPDFSIPTEELKGQRQREAITEWGRIKQRYEYAARVNELGGQFGRIQPIISDMRSLIEWVPASPSLRRYLAYFLFLSGSIQEAFKNYQDASFIWQSDWYNVAALALRINKDMHACYSLEQVFKQQPIVDREGAINRAPTDGWYVYVGLWQKSGDYSLLSNIRDVDGGVGAINRAPTEAEEQLLLETGIYLLKCKGKEELAQELLQSWLRGMPARLVTQEVFKQLGDQLSSAYQQVVSELRAAQQSAIALKAARQAASEATGDEEKKPPSQTSPQQLQGYIYTYKIGRNYGFLSGSDGGNYFFHRNAVSDEELLERIEDLQETFLRAGEQIPVIFEVAQGPKGPLAVGVSLYRTVDEIFEMAYNYAEEGEYARAVTQVKRVLTLDPEYPGAKEVYEKWSEYARVVVVPRGSNPYARAKRALLVEKDLEKAAQLFDVAINENDNTESAIKDLAVLLGRMGHSQEAINVLERNREKITDQQSIDNLLIDIYQKTGQYAQALELLEKSMKNATTRERKAHILWQMANCHLRQDNFANAERLFREVIDLGFDRRAAQRNIALCLVKQQKYADE